MSNFFTAEQVAWGRKMADQLKEKMPYALKKALDYTLSNVSPAAVCGWLSWELR